MLTVSSYGWLRDTPDQRDHVFTLARTEPLPPMIDLRANCPSVYDQGDLGSCTANALAGAVEFDERKQGVALSVTPSRLFLYYNERVREHTIFSDSGAMLRDGIKSLAKQGDCPESMWPYDLMQFTTRPPQACYTDALQRRISSYMRVPRSLRRMRICLAEGYAFVFGFTVYESFESGEVARTGVVPMPALSEVVLGGHAVVCVGYDHARSVFLFRNSWGTSWGDGGYGTMPYEYLLSSNLAADFWTIRTVMPGAA